MSLPASLPVRDTAYWLVIDGGEITAMVREGTDGAQSLREGFMRIKLTRRSAGGVTGGRRARSSSAVRQTELGEA